MSEKRAFPRTPGAIPVKLSHEIIGTIVLETRDIADGGVFITLDDRQLLPATGDILTIKLQGFMTGLLKEVDARVVRVAEHGFAIEFMQSPFED